VKGEKLEN